jgi:hypothetical protein
MIVGMCTIELDLPGTHSLKEKRSILKGLIARLRREFNVAVAEVDLNDAWGSATLGVAVVSNAAPHAERALERVVYWIERHRPDLNVVDYHFEIIS